MRFGLGDRRRVSGRRAQPVQIGREQDRYFRSDGITRMDKDGRRQSNRRHQPTVSRRTRRRLRSIVAGAPVHHHAHAGLRSIRGHHARHASGESGNHRHKRNQEACPSQHGFATYRIGNSGLQVKQQHLTSAQMIIRLDFQGNVRFSCAALWVMFFRPRTLSGKTLARNDGELTHAARPLDPFAAPQAGILDRPRRASPGHLAGNARSSRSRTPKT